MSFLQEEAKQFAANIKLMEKDIRGLKLADETFMNTCQQVLASDLPRVSAIEDQKKFERSAPMTGK